MTLNKLFVSGLASPELLRLWKSKGNFDPFWSRGWSRFTCLAILILTVLLYESDTRQGVIVNSILIFGNGLALILNMFWWGSSAKFVRACRELNKLIPACVQMGETKLRTMADWILYKQALFLHLYEEGGFPIENSSLQLRDSLRRNFDLFNLFGLTEPFWNPYFDFVNRCPAGTAKDIYRFLASRTAESEWKESAAAVAAAS